MNFFVNCKNLVQVNNAAAPGLVIAKPEKLRSFKDGAAFVSTEITNLWLRFVFNLVNVSAAFKKVKAPVLGKV